MFTNWKIFTIFLIDFSADSYQLLKIADFSRHTIIKYGLYLHRRRYYSDNRQV